MPECHSCGASNQAGQAFCGSCASALDLKAFIAAEVKSGVAASIKDREALELESAAKVFEKAYGWLKLLVGAAIALLVGSVTLMGIKARDYSSLVEQQMQAITEQASIAKGSVTQASEKAIGSIQDTSGKAIRANNDSAQKAAELSTQLDATAKSARSEIEAAGASVKKDTKDAQVALQDAERIQPQFDERMRQLNAATAAVDRQQKTLSSTQNFVKEIFSSYQNEIVDFSKANGKVAKVPEPGNLPSIATVYLLLDHAPIMATLHAQAASWVLSKDCCKQIAHNLISMQFGPYPFNVDGGQVSIEYYPDLSDKEHIKGLTVRDRRVWADGQPLMNVGNPEDPGFPGNKWQPPKDATGKPVQPK